MAAKNIAEVVIAGKVLKITGYESTEYLHQVAAYINDKISQFEEMEEYRKQPGDQKQILIYMNLADDFFKASRQAEQQKAELEKKEKEMYSLRHDLIESQMARENLEHTSREEREKLELEAKEKLESVKKSCKEKLEQQEAEHLE
ncbi:MAG: cell division protein ZapA, partial [Lachnospiraceae bacterium]|nr:cell division protein ZapA [Lachnospiraceae bacterium]